MRLIHSRAITPALKKVHLPIGGSQVGEVRAPRAPAVQDALTLSTPMSACCCRLPLAVRQSAICRNLHPKREHPPVTLQPRIWSCLVTDSSCLPFMRTGVQHFAPPTLWQP